MLEKIRKNKKMENGNDKNIEKKNVELLYKKN